MAGTPLAGREVAVQVAGEEVEEAERLLLDAGAQSLTLSDPGEHPILEPAPGETPLWPEVLVTALFPPAAATGAVLATLRSAGLEVIATREVGEEDWVRVWMDRFEPMQFGERLWVVPSHREPPAEAEVFLRLDPGLAFGTGTHPSTALCLEFLSRTELTGGRVLDYGCGSGILAVAAARLGARHVVAVDTDPQARLATRANARRNGVEAQVEVGELGLLGPHGFDVIVANILAGTLVSIAPIVARLAGPGAKLALSGILPGQEALVRSAYRSEFSRFETREREGWLLLTARAGAG